MQFELGFIGAGNMAEAIIRGAIAGGEIEPAQIIVADPSSDRLKLFDELNIATTSDNQEVVRRAAQIVLAVKPQMVDKITGELAAIDADTQIVISIMAGLGSAKYSELAGKPLRIVRVMPNTPMLVGAGMSGVALGEHARPGDDDLAMRLFAAGGKAVRVTEAELDGITAVSGSGPAYVFYLAEAMQAAAEKIGVKADSDLLVRQTILGAAKLLSASADSPAELRRKVSSPGGTTEAAINTMAARDLPAIVCEGMQAAEKRSRELGE